MTKKLVKTMLVCLCLIYTFNTASALSLKSAIETATNAVPSTEITKEQVAEIGEVKIELKAATKIKAKVEAKAETEIKNEIKAAEQPVAAAASIEQNVAVISAAPAPAPKPASPAPAAKSPVGDIKKMIVDVALSMGVDPYVALSIAKLESGFDQSKRNPSGAIGLFQLMPGTARFLGVNPHIASENIKGGILYYKQMYKRYGSMDLALAAYNAGPGNVAKYGGIPPFRETQAFVTKVKREYHVFKADPLLKPSSTL